MTDAGHAGIPYNLVLRYLKIPFEPGYVGVGRKIGKKLDGLECFLPSLFTVKETRLEERVRSYMSLSDSLAKRFGSDFRFYSFHGCYEDPHEMTSQTALNLADNSSKEKAKMLSDSLKVQCYFANRIANSPYESGKSDAVIRPIMNLHLGRVRRESEKKGSIKKIILLLDKAMYDDRGYSMIAVENLDPGKRGFYNLGEKEEDIEAVLAKVTGMIMTYDIGHVDAVEFKKMRDHGKLPRDEEETAEAFLKYQNKFLDRFQDRIGHMHLSFNDIFFNRQPNGYYDIGRHCPLTKAERFPIFYDQAFRPVVKRAMGIIAKNRGKDASVNLEIPRRKIFTYTFADCGADVDELAASIRMAREIYNS